MSAPRCHWQSYLRSAAATTPGELGDTYEKPIIQTEIFSPAVLFEDKGKPIHLSARLSGPQNNTPQGPRVSVSNLRSRWDDAERGPGGHSERRPLQGSGPKASLHAIRSQHAVEKKQAKSFHVVLYICGSIYRAWCALIPAETFSLPALWALIAGAEGRTQHYHQARLRAAEWHFPFMQKLTPNAGQSGSQDGGTARDPAWQPRRREISGTRKSAPLLRQETKVGSDSIWSVSRCRFKNKGKPNWRDGTAALYVTLRCHGTPGRALHQVYFSQPLQNWFLVTLQGCISVMIYPALWHPILIASWEVRPVFIASLLRSSTRGLCWKRAIPLGCQLHETHLHAAPELTY